MSTKFYMSLEVSLNLLNTSYYIGCMQGYKYYVIAAAFWLRESKFNFNSSIYKNMQYRLYLAVSTTQVMPICGKCWKHSDHRVCSCTSCLNEITFDDIVTWTFDGNSDFSTWHIIRFGYFNFIRAFYSLRSSSMKRHHAHTLRIWWSGTKTETCVEHGRSNKEEYYYTFIRHSWLILKKGPNSKRTIMLSGWIPSNEVAKYSPICVMTNIRRAHVMSVFQRTLSFLLHRQEILLKVHTLGGRP